MEDAALRSTLPGRTGLHHPHQPPAGFSVETDELVNPTSASGGAEDSSGPSGPDGVWGAADAAASGAKPQESWQLVAVTTLRSAE